MTSSTGTLRCGLVRILIESVPTPGKAYLVHLHINGIRLTTQTDSAEVASALVLRLAADLGMPLPPLPPPQMEGQIK